MVKKIFILLLSIMPSITFVHSSNIDNSYLNEESKLSKEEKEDLEGRRKLPLNKRITAEKRYFGLVKKLFVPEDKDDICNQLLYIENGYFDYGYLPTLKTYYDYKNIPEGFWVYVYPNWYIWNKQILF